MRPSLYELIHCLVITYNRAENLRNTLARLAASPFREARVTVLDNASIDATPAVTAEFGSRFPHYQVIRHPYNIGGPCNLMRAFELSQARYTWVLGDDDQLNPVDIGDVHDVMAAESADVISLSLFRRPETMSGNFYTYEEAVRAGVFFFSCFSQITNTVFKTSLLDSRLMHQGYRLAHTLFTQFPLLIKLAVENRRVYCAREVVITRSFYDGPTWTAADLWIGWVEVCALIPNPVIRERALQDYFGNPKPLWLVLPKVILQSHAQENGQTPLFRRSARFLSSLARATTILTCWICFLPPGCIRAGLKILYRLAGRPYDFMPPPKGPGAAMDILRQ